jgi:DnaJ-domain-containing protein 1
MPANRSTPTSLDSIIAFTKASFFFARITHKLIGSPKNNKLAIVRELSEFVAPSNDDDAWIDELIAAISLAANAFNQAAEQANKMHDNDTNPVYTHYWASEVLGVGLNADYIEVKRAFKSLVKQYHPDVNKAPDANSRYIEVLKAYQILTT